ncbi:MAG: LCP family protein [Alkalispirochaeta sp.]
MATQKINATVVFLLLILMAVTVTVGFLYSQLRTDEISTSVAEGELLRVLVVAEEEKTPFLAFFLFYHPETSRVAVLDIPQNVGGVFRSLGRVDSIDQVFAREGPDAYRREVEQLTGTAVETMLVFSREGLSDFIDLLGGLELFIVTDYRSVDNDNPVMLPAGNVTLDGPKALDYLQLTDANETDLERTGRRQAFVQSFLRQVGRNADLLQHPEVVDIRDRLFESSLDRRARTSLFRELSSMGVERLVRRRIQGTIRVVDVEGDTRNLLFPHFEGEWLRQSVQQIETTLATSEDDARDQFVVSMEILNGTASAGMARRTTQMYEDFGFAVSRFGNADSDQIDHTLVIDRRGTGQSAEQVAEIIDAHRVVTEVTPDSDVDVTLILGRDFDGTVVRSDN